MATTSLLLLLSPLSSSPHTQLRSQIRTRSIVRAQTGTRNEDIVIIGAGIAGLATAVSLHRLGVGSVVVEQGDLLRTGGTSLTLFKNGWRVLDAIGVGHHLRPQFLEIQGMTVKSEDGRELRSFRFKDEDQSQEVRAVERRILLETLANQLPPDTISYSSKLAKIEKSESSETLLELADGTKISAKIVIGCDGIRSPVAKWMGHSEPNYVGHCAFRGLGVYPDGQPYEPRVNYIYGRGVRAGFVPVSPTKVYWFICFNSSSPGPKIIDPSELKKQAIELVRNWPSELLKIIDHTPDDTIIRSSLVDRWLWPAVSPPASAGKVVLVGDAWHPMTPNLGQGACCALEDAVVLARKLAGAVKTGSTTVEDALKSYGDERWPRIFPLTIRANVVGSLLQWDNAAVCSVRNNVIIPKVVRLGPMLEHTNFDCEPL
ncbi:FAD-dependent urate hydroxylase [Actinidia chinensis var. chinensis]|uniref:FAD-dependent urate hydroxylase n=1 Tax=Actinidia chinensis var. chinensis TaxID=1590841 RepID=A0A2R6PMA0_ACTCC|nr:FAD-dependent urate hydroxylase [Actinidia chinensis var. chinensis]